MDWPSIETIESLITLPEGYSVQVLKADEIKKLITLLSTWYPEIEVGAGSQFMDPQYYLAHTCLKSSNNNRKILPLLFMHEGQICGFVAYEKDVYRGSLMAHTLAISEDHRQSGLGTVSNILLENMGREMGAAIAYWYGALLHPYSQWVAEKRGWMLCGILPAFNVRKIKGSTSKRIFTAMYIKVLAEKEDILFPQQENLIIQTQALYQFLFDQP